MKFFYGKQYINSKDQKKVLEVLKSNYLTQGPKIDIFEKKLINKFGQIIINALKFDCGVLKLKNPITGEIQEKKHTLLSTFLTIWNYHDPDLLEGMYMVRLSVRMMGKLILLRDPDIENVIVDGDEIINVNEGRRTRSSKKKINYQQVPWPLRAFQSMARRVDDPRDDDGAKDDFGDTFGGDDMLMMQQFAKEGGLLGDDGVLLLPVSSFFLVSLYIFETVPNETKSASIGFHQSSSPLLLPYIFSRRCLAKFT